MNGIMGQSGAVFFVLSALAVFLAVLSARSCALGWHSLKRVAVYAVAVAFAHRFLLFALRGAELTHGGGALLSVSVLGVVAVLSYRYFRGQLYLKQYPWLYEQHSFGRLVRKTTQVEVFI